MKKLHPKSLTLAAAACLLLAGSASFAQDAPRDRAKAPARTAPAQSLTVDEILRRAIGRARENEQREKREKFLYRQTNLVEKLDGNRQTKEKEERVHEVVEIDGGLYTRLVAKNGKPLAGKDLKEEQKREQKWRDAVAKAKSEPGKKKSEKKNEDAEDDDVRFDEALVAKYKVELLGEDTVANRPAWVIAFEPKSNDLPAKRRVERLLNKLAGKLWIDKEGYEITRAEARLIERVRLVGGIVASVNAFDLKVTQRPLEGDTWVPAHMEMYMDGRIMFTSLHQRMKTTWEAHRRQPAAVAGSRND